MKKVNYVLVDLNTLPSVYSKVIEAKKLISNGDANSISEAVKNVGLSRSAFYKYRDSVFEYNGDGDGIAEIHAKLKDNAGVLSRLINEVYVSGANVLSINQKTPVNGKADVTITIEISEMTSTLEELIEKVKVIEGVRNAEVR